MFKKSNWQQCTGKSRIKLGAMRKILFLILLQISSIAMAQSMARIDSVYIKYNFRVTVKQWNCVAKRENDVLKLDSCQISILQNHFLAKMKKLKGGKFSFDHKDEKTLNIFCNDGSIYNCYPCVEQDVARLSRAFVSGDTGDYYMENFDCFLNDVIANKSPQFGKLYRIDDDGELIFRLYNGKSKKIKEVKFRNNECILVGNGGIEKSCKETETMKCCAQIINKLFTDAGAKLRLYSFEVEKTECQFSVSFKCGGVETEILSMHYVDAPRILYNKQLYELLDYIRKIK